MGGGQAIAGEPSTPGTTHLWLPPGLGGWGGRVPLNRTNALSKSSYFMEDSLHPRRCRPEQPVWSPPEPPERGSRPRRGRPRSHPSRLSRTRCYMRAERIPPTRRAAATTADPRTRCSAGPPGGLTSLPGAPGPARPRRADDGSVSRALAPRRAPRPPDPSSGEPPPPIARAPPGARGALTYPKHEKEPL